MATVRGSFRALHRLIVRMLRRLSSSLRHPQPVHAAELRRAEHPAASTSALVEGPTLVEEVENTPFGFEVPDEDDPAELLREVALRGEQERVTLEVLEGETLVAVQAPTMASMPEQKISAEPRGTPEAMADENEGAAPIHNVQGDRDGEEWLSSSLSPLPSAEAGDGSSAARVTAVEGTPLRVPRTPKQEPNPLHAVRDMEAIKLIVRLRLLSYRQLRTWLFRGHPSMVGRSMQRLAKRDWLALHMDYLTLGGHPIYAFPTAKAMRWAREQFLKVVAGTTHEKLVQTMLPNAAKSLSIPQPRSAPAYLAHQELANDVAFALEHDPKLRIPWLSTWPRPFPHIYGSMQLPQPDLVFVGDVKGMPYLFFGELDHNSNESLAHFQNRKAYRARVFDQSNGLHVLTGFMTFRMLVIIADTKDPLGRMKKLIAATRRAGATHLLAFTLMPWLLPDPSGLIWFADGMMPTHGSLVAGKHHGLKRLEQLARKPETVEEILERERRRRA